MYIEYFHVYVPFRKLTLTIFPKHFFPVSFRKEGQYAVIMIDAVYVTKTAYPSDTRPVTFI